MKTKRRTRSAAKRETADAVDGLVRLEGALQIRGAAELVRRLRTAVDAGALRLDAAAVSQVDTAGLQALVAAVASARRTGDEPEWLAVSPSLADAARRLGVGTLLALPAASAD
jgi:phospholipid transport system transporter-binding protein